jgi:cell division initiation protein
MPYTPVDLRHARIERGFLGYRRVAVDQLLDDVADSFEDVWRDRGELADKLEAVEKQLGELRDREALLSRTLAAAEQVAAEVRDQAKREAEVVVAEAHHEARSIARSGQAEKERLFAEVRRIEALLRSALGIVETAHSVSEASGDKDGGAADDAVVEPWPRREDTREFARGMLPVAALPAEPEAQTG